jgi:hypothetical protein
VDVESAPLQDMLDEWAATFETFSRPKPGKPAPVAAVAALAPVQASTSPAPAVAAPVATPAPVRGQPPVQASAAPAPAAKDAQEAEGAPVVAQEAEGAPVVAQEAPVPVVLVHYDPGDPPLLIGEDEQGIINAPPSLVTAYVPEAPAPADNFEAAIIEDGGEALPAAPVKGKKVAKPLTVEIRVGAYDQQIPEELFIPWWNELVAGCGGEWDALVAEVKKRLLMPEEVAR